MEFIRYDVCEACLWFIAYGEVPEGNEVSEQEISEAMRREIGDTGGHFACGAPPTEDDEDDDEEQDEYTEFSWRPCELCRSHLGGSRHAITLCIPDHCDDGSGLLFTGSDPSGRKAEIRKDGGNKHSVFRWKDNGTGVHLWREYHGMEWAQAVKYAQDWLNNGRDSPE